MKVQTDAHAPRSHGFGATSYARAMSREVVLSAYVKWASASDPVPPGSIPVELQATLRALQAGEVSEEAACAVASKYVAANFMVENLAGGDELFADAEEVWATETEVNTLRFVEGKPLPLVTAAAAFRLKTLEGFPADEDALEAWTDDHGPFTDAINFFWRFGDDDVVLGDYEEAGAGLES